MSRQATPNTYSYLSGTIIRETAAAILFKVAATGNSEWFPLSQIKEIHRSPDDTTGEDQIQVADWILGKKGIEL